MELAAIATILAALGGVIKLVLDAMGRQGDKFTAALEKQQDRQELFLSNHMSKQTRAMEDLAASLRALAEEVKEWTYEERRH